MKAVLYSLFVAASIALPLRAMPALSEGSNMGASSPMTEMPKQCQPGKTSTEPLGWRFRQGTLVRVYYLKGNFSAREQEALTRAVNNWNDALRDINSRIVFRTSGESESLSSDVTSIVVMRGEPKGKERVGEIKLHSVTGGRAHLVVVISPKIKEPDALTSLMTHELGHSVGLADCYECRTGTTAMAAFRGNRGNDVYEPSECDRYAVAAGYAGGGGRVDTAARLDSAELK